MMNKKTKTATAVAVFLFMLVALEIVYIFSELYNENDIKQEPVITDAMKFKSEYEKLNGTKTSNNDDVRFLQIDEDNPFIYVNEDDLLKKLDDKESFIVYFGFNSCPWCRSIVLPLIEAAKENNITKIYYLDVSGIRDRFELDDDNKAVRTVEGTEGYYKLLERFDNVLDDYAPLVYKNKKNKEKKVKIDEKRIYAPNVVAVKDGEAVSMESGLVDSLLDAYMEIDDGIKCEIKEEFKCLFDLLKDDVEVCDIDSKKC